MIKNNYDFKTSLNKEFVSEKFKNLEKNLTTIMLYCFLGGIIAGMVGIGGGMITNPLMIGMGLDPKVL